MIQKAYFDHPEGHMLLPVALPEEIVGRVRSRDWDGLDRAIRKETLPGGVIFERLRALLDFAEIEFIISIRGTLRGTSCASDHVPDEDGIWHDDGSRRMAFSLSLTERPGELEGGVLEIRRRFDEETPSSKIPTPPFGTMIVFATGEAGFEHKINRVIQGERIIIAGWCT